MLRLSTGVRELIAGLSSPSPTRWSVLGEHRRRFDLRKLFVSIVAALCIGGLAGSALASTTINWTGQGSENLPCGRGGHWVLTGKGITSATLTVGSHAYTMSQNGGGSFSANPVGLTIPTTVAS